MIASFTATPSSVVAGQSTTLSWSVTGAASLSISGGVGSVTGQTSRAVSPTATTTYVLTATNASGGSVTASATVTVTAPATGPYPAGLSTATIQVGAVMREFRVHVPAGLALPPKALVLVLHGGGGEGLDVSLAGNHPLSVFRSVADREGFVVVYPGGLPATDGNPGWDDCRSDNLTASGADDIGFLDALISRLRSEYGLPASRVFLSGGSNGAQMVFAYAVTRAENFGAIAVGSGNLPLNPKPGACSAPPARRVPVLMTHGTADVPMPYSGGCVANLGGACNRGRVIGAEATRDYWLQTNGLSGSAPSTTVVNVDNADGGSANRFAYAGSEPVEWWRLDGAGHPAPSRTVAAGNAVSGPQNRDVEFAEIAWTFFSSRLPAATPLAAAAVQSAQDYNASVGGQTFLVMQGGVVLAESYSNGGSTERRQLLASATKGFTGMLGAIAATDGLIGLDEPLAERALSEWRSDAQKSRITYRHVLTMTSGLEELNDLPGWLSYLPAPVLHPAGTVFRYSGDPNIFGLALERRLGGESVVDYFDRRLFRPLGMTVEWASNFSDGRPNLSGGAYATARDWARFGEFMRRTLDGSWSGPALVSRALFDQVLAGNVAHPAYGFYWWLKRPVPSDRAAVIDANNSNQYTRQIKPVVDDPRIPSDLVWAAGAFGQRLYVIPSRSLTVLRNGPANNNSFSDVEFLSRLLGSGAP
ncbi:MAG: serine hydrolase [Steroidobacteraceae bacterium]|nr:serine hydrolase [Steroidobacteraceae bacterium]